MAQCPKCGNKIAGGMAFCPKCGAPLRVAQAPAPPPPAAPRRDEKGEKNEKREKREKEEKGEEREKSEISMSALLIGGLILILLGLLSYLQLAGFFRREVSTAMFLIVIGVLVIIGAIYAISVAGRRYPRT